jgi:hypothetical protein
MAKKLAAWVMVAVGAWSGLPVAAQAGNIDLGVWMLQLPTGQQGKPDTVSAKALMEGYSSSYFYTGADGALAFWCPENGVHTPNSRHGRSELREMNRDGSAANWDVAGTHILDATLSVEKVPANTAIGQIHVGSVLKPGLPTSTKPLVELYYHSNGDVVAGIENSPAGGQSSHLLANIPLHTRFSYQIMATASELTITVNGTPHVYPLPASFIGYGEYFKAGNYIQSNSDSSDIGALVKFYALSVSHKG